MVITALLLKPLIASSIEIISNKRRRPTAPNATTSIAATSKTNASTIIKTINTNCII